MRPNHGFYLILMTNNTLMNAKARYIIKQRLLKFTTLAAVAILLLLSIPRVVNGQQSFIVSGRVIIQGDPSLERPKVALKNSTLIVETDEKGNFQIASVPAGMQTLVAFSLGKKNAEINIQVNSNIEGLRFVLVDIESELDVVRVQGKREGEFSIGRLQAVDNFGVYDGRKTEVIVLKEMLANTATNNARQVYSRITGLNIWESDQAGLQLGIGGRGLSPNRTSNFNVRQNGYDISADALGYPESYYTPPVEALEQIEVVRGAASLQYGTQFGGMLNFRFKRGDENVKFRFTGRQSVGSWGFLGSFNSVEGRVGKLRYYSFYQHKRGDGYRPNSGFKSNNLYTSLDYTFSEKFSANLELTKMQYLAQQAGGLTDRNFMDNPRSSFRERNWFQVDWNLAALNFTYNFSDRTKLNTRNFALLASRKSLGNLERINIADFGEERTLIVGDFTNFGNETRLMHWYQMGDQINTFLVGSRAYYGTTTAQQGFGSDGNDADFRFLNPNELEDSDYRFPNRNFAVFAENIFNLSNRWSLTPGIRWENIQTYAEGYYKQYVFDGAGNIIVQNRVDEELERLRSFLILGLGSSFKASDQMEIYANISQNYRGINFTDLRINNPNLRVDPNIADEKGYTADLGIKGQKEALFTYELTLFYLRYFGKIGQVLRTDSVLFNDYRYRTNIADARNMGIEAFGELSLLSLLRKEKQDRRWTLFANLALIDARYIRTDDSSIRNKKVEMVPPFTAKLGSAFRIRDFSFSAQYSYVGEHFSDASNAIRTATAVEGLIPAYAVADITASYRWKSLVLEMSVNNLFNEQYFTRRAEAYPGPGIIPADGRGFYTTVEFKF